MKLTYRLNKNGLVVIGGKDIESEVIIPNEDCFKGKNYPVIAIGNRAFSSCEKLTSIVIPDSVTRIGNEAFRDCSALTSIEIPDSVTKIGLFAFLDCSSLTSVVIPDSVTKIGDWAFWGCEGLTSIVIPDSVTKIGEDAFLGCSALTSIIVDKGNRHYDSRENCNAIIESDTNTLIVGCSNTVIPDSVTEIEKTAFRGRSGLTSIVIPDSITKIGPGAFWRCSGLTSIVINDTSLLKWAGVPDGVEIVKP